MKKRMLAMAAVLAMCFGVLPTGTWATENETVTCVAHIAPQYEDANSFSEGLAAVKKDGKWGYIDTEGKVVIPFEYDSAGNFSEGYALVGVLTEINGYSNPDYPVYKMGFLDKSGNLTWFDPDYVDEDTGAKGIVTNILPAALFHNGYVAFEYSAGEGARGNLFDTSGHSVQLPRDPNEIPEQRGATPWKWQVTEDTVILSWVDSMQYEIYYDFATRTTFFPAAGGGDYISEVPNNIAVSLRPFNQGLAPVAWRNDNGDIRWGFINKQSEWVIQPSYLDFMVAESHTEYQVFDETGLAMVQDESGKWGAIDKTGQTVIPFQYDKLYPYHFGLARFLKDSKYGFLNTDGEIAIPAQYESCSSFTEGYAVAETENQTYLIDTNGQMVPGSDKVGAYASPQDGCFLTEKDGKYGYAQLRHTEPEPTEPTPTPTPAPTPTPTPTTEPERPPVVVPPPTPRPHSVSCPVIPGGTVTASPASAVEGATITLTAVPEEGYELKSLTVTGAHGTIPLNGTSFTMPDEAVTVTAVFAKLPEPTPVSEVFTDIQPNQWFESAVQYVYDKGLMAGVAENVFDPYSSADRAMIVTILWRLAEQPAAEKAGFTDIAENSYYAEAVAWAAANGIVTGHADNSFRPNDAITREQLAAMIYRYAGNPAAAGDLSGFSDGDKVGGYAISALKWAVEKGIFTGKGGFLDPKGIATRAEVAAVLTRFLTLPDSSNG